MIRIQWLVARGRASRKYAYLVQKPREVDDEDSEQGGDNWLLVQFIIEANELVVPFPSQMLDEQKFNEQYYALDGVPSVATCCISPHGSSIFVDQSKR